MPSKSKGIAHGIVHRFMNGITQCKVKFSFTLAEQETEKICAGYDKKTNTCLYDEECNGEIVEPRKNFKSPAFTLNNNESVRNWGENGLFPKCRSD